MSEVKILKPATGIHTALQGLLRELPTPGPWEKSQKEGFMQAFKATIDFIYPEDINELKTLPALPVLLSSVCSIRTVKSCGNCEVAIRIRPPEDSLCLDTKTPSPQIL